MPEVRGNWAASFMIVLLYALTAFGGERVGRESAFNLVSKTAGEWEFKYVPSAHEITTVMIDGTSYLRYSQPAPIDKADDVPGAPSLPVDALTLGIPFGSELEVDLINPSFETLGQQNIAPSPIYQFTDEQEAVELFKCDASRYAENRFVPARQVSVESPFTLRQQRVSTVRIRPYQYNPVTKILRRLVGATLRVRLRKSELPAANRVVQAGESADPLFEETYKSLLANYEEAKAWRFVQRQPPIPLADSTRDWFETGRNYYKALIGTDGWYKITPADIRQAGGNVGGIDPTTVKVLARGVEIPVLVRADTTVEFYAVHHLGDSTYSDFYTDSSAYWLTWGGTSGLRFSPSSANGTPVSLVGSASQTIHFEQNLSYYTGTTTDEQINTNTVPGEGWIWRSFNVNGQVDFPFVVDSVDASAPAATIRARLWGTGYVSPPGTPAQHQARFWLNDSLLGNANFGQRQAGLLNVTFPSGILKTGANVLRIRNIDTGTGGNSFYFDWFEIDYQRNLRAVNDQLAFVSPPSSGGSPAQFTVRGFSNPQIEVYDLSGRKMITGGLVSGDSLSGYSVAFLDTFSTARTYVVVCAGGQRAVPPLRQKMFTDIRTNPQGADYVIITHRNFLTQANQLAQHRQSTNGVRVKVIDVDDIYDEFNYGVLNATTIKTFLKYAYDQWAAPSLTNVVFLGDACWDYHRYYASTIKTNYVPSYGIPSGDNWFGCFDSTVSFIPSFYIGRMPCENVTQAQNCIDKVIAYDSYALSDWNKKFLFITGGNSTSEQAGFNYLSESSIASYVAPAPFGGNPLRVYKATIGVVDGENKATIQNLIREGTVFLNFIGHSGGRVWGVDPGPASEFPNTNGRLPFVSSVTCNVGGFASPANNVFSEDLLVAPNRGAIAVWASSSVGYATYGAALTNYFLANATIDSVRAFGALTTNARYRLWLETGAGYITVAMLNLNPLIGDPLSRWAIPLKPDLALHPDDVLVSNTTPTPNDSTLSVKIRVHNYGLVPRDSAALSVTGIYNGQTTVLLHDWKLQKILYLDSVNVPWNGQNSVGLHTLVAQADPLNTILETNELNNITSTDQYVYANSLFVVKPLNNMVASSGPQRLIVTSPVGYDSAGFTYFFELDTTDTFNSPGLITSGPVVPMDAKGEWITPSLPGGRVVFWRARTMQNTVAGNWLTSCFSTSNDLPVRSEASGERVRVGEFSIKQFARDILTNVSSTDSGVTISRRAPLTIYARSVGYRYNQTAEYYSSFQVNDQKVTGFWWELGNSFMVIRVNEFSGTMDFRAFPVSSNASQADSMRNFLAATPAGNYIGVSVIFDGQTNVSEGLKLAMDSLGSTQFRSILAGQSYAFLGRKGINGPWMAPLEQRTNDTAVVSLTVPNYYSLGGGTFRSASLPIAQRWDSLHWRQSGDPATTSANLVLLGLRVTGGADTLRVISRDSADVSLSSLTPLTAGPRYNGIQVTSQLSTSDANVTPVLSSWWLDFEPPPDLAVSARSLGSTKAPVFDFPITVSNIGYQKSDSVRITVNALDKYNTGKQIATAFLDSIDVDASRSTSVSFATSGFPYKTTLQVIVGPLHKGRDLIAENNTAYYTLYRSGIGPPQYRVQVFADGKEIMDGDYVSDRPSLLVKAEEPNNGIPVAAAQVQLLVDNMAVPLQSTGTLAKSTSPSNSEQMFAPSLPDGEHELKFRLGRVNAFGDVDTLEHSMHVRVLKESRILQTYTYPNPFVTETDFTFILTGSMPPDDMRIRIFTVAGRKIREIDIPAGFLRIGFNRIHWDGRDSDGDEIANGYYFYQLTAKNGSKTETTIQKLVKVR